MKGNSSLSLLPQLVSIALPTSGGRLLTILANFIAMMMVAQFGAQAMAAGLLAVTSSTAILILTSGIFYALGIQIRYYRGQKQSAESIGVLVKNGFFLAIILALPAALVMMCLDQMLLFVGQDPILVAMTTEYFFYAAIGMFPMLIMMVIGQFYIGIDKPSFTLITGMINLPLTVILSYALVLGHWGWPALGLAGVSLASALTQLFMVLGALLIIYLTKLHKAYNLGRNFLVFDWHICYSLLVLGAPIGLQLGGELVVMALANYLMGYLGIDAMAALQITSQYAMLVIMLNFGLAQALAYVISEAHGKQEVSYLLIKKYTKAALILLIGYTLPISLLFCLSAAFLAKVYMGTHQLALEFIILVRAFFILGALFLFFDGARTLLSGILRGLQDTKAASRINLLAMWCVSLPVSLFTIFIAHGGPISLRVSFLSGFLVAAIALAIHLYQKLAQTPDADTLVDISAKLSATQ